MVVVNTTGSEINTKIVYYGPALSGKTTNLEQIYERMPSDAKGKMVSMKTRTDRTLFFDFLPLELGDISGYRTRMLLYTVPGQVYYNATRKLVLKGADAVVFVADSSAAKMGENIESLRNLEENLNELGLTLDTSPWVIQYNKRDLKDAVPVGTLESELNLLRVPSFEAIATQGIGVYETFQGIAGILYSKLVARFSARDRVPAASARGSYAPPADQTVSQVIDVALREVTGPATAAEPPRAGAPRPVRRSTPPEAARPVFEPPRELRRPERACADAGGARRSGTDDDTLRFESLEVAPIDEKVGRVVDLGKEPAPGFDRAESPPSGLFITEAFRATETADEYKNGLSRSIARPEPVSLRNAAPGAGDECVITVPVLITRSQVRKTIPIKLRLEVQVVDDD
jgi:signal recognition particle receptor subunit beta